MPETLINPAKLHEELALSGLPIAGVSSDGRIDYTRPLSKAEQAKAQEVIDNHNPEQNILPTTDQMIIALWKKVMLDDSKDADSIAAAVKSIL
jgi:hypothetical protein